MKKILLCLVSLLAVGSAQNVGFKISQLGTVPTAIWYPTTAAEAPYAYSSSTHGSVAKNASVASGQFPLVIFSHGYTGCAIQSVFVTETLARSGYIVAAPQHKDAGCDINGGKGKIAPAPQQPFSFPWRWSDATYRDRHDDIETVLNTLLVSSDFGSVINQSEISVMGHSLGGYTALGMVGGWPSWKDSRFTAALTYSPYVEPFMLNSTLGGMNVPVMYQGSDNDSADTRYIAKSNGAYDQSSTPKIFLELINADHYVWTNSTCDAYATPALCIAAVPNASFILQYSAGFLDNYTQRIPQAFLFPAQVPPAGLLDYRFQQ